jgi:hypothetical protein
MPVPATSRPWKARSPASLIESAVKAPIERKAPPFGAKPEAGATTSAALLDG